MTEEPRQRVERASGRARRAKLTPAPGSDPSPETPVPGAESPEGADRDERALKRKRAASGDDDRISRERPPHWG